MANVKWEMQMAVAALNIKDFRNCSVLPDKQGFIREKGIGKREKE